MKYFISGLIVYFLLLVISASFAQPAPEKKKVTVTGVRFAYPLVQKWINEYQSANPGVEISISPRTTLDPATYDLLIEAYEPEVKSDRDYVFLARYAIIPFANSKSEFARVYSKKGFDELIIKKIFFEGVFDEKAAVSIKAPYTVYTRLQKAGAPVTFAHYFGFDQKNISGKGISGADEHLIKSVLRDSLGVSYAPINLLFDLNSGKPVDGVTIIPVDLNGNGKVSDDEKFYSTLTSVVSKLSSEDMKPVRNLPVEHIHFSIRKDNTNAEAAKFLDWVQVHSQESLNAFGFIAPDAAHINKNIKRI